MTIINSDPNGAVARHPSAIPPRLWWLVDRLENPVVALSSGTSYRVPTARITDDDRAGARAALGQLDIGCRPPSRDQVLAWLKPINAGIRNPVDEATLMTFAMLVVEQCASVPASAFNADSRREAAMHPDFKFFPSVADVAMIVRPYGDRLTRLRAALKRIAASKPALPPAPAEPPMTEGERATLADEFRALRQGIEQRAAREAPVAKFAETVCTPAMRLAALEGLVAGEATVHPDIASAITKLRAQVAA